MKSIPLQNSITKVKFYLRENGKMHQILGKLKFGKLQREGHLTWQELKGQFDLCFKLRARQNVVLEFGYFMGLLGRDRVSCLLKGDVERPSDMQGIVYIPFKESIEECRDMIIKELGNEGYKI